MVTDLAVALSKSGLVCWHSGVWDGLRESWDSGKNGTHFINR